MDTSVLIPLAEHTDKDNDIGALHYVRETYIRRLEAHDLTPIFVSHAMEEPTVSRLFAATSGLLITGGLDVDPKHYTQEDVHPESRPAGDRDWLELKLLRKAYERRRPVLGICRGCQMLAVTAGGRLNQHVPDHTDEAHGKSTEGLAYDHVQDIEHEVLIAPDSRLADIVGRKRITVNSGHHQAVAEPGDSFRVAARSPAGVIEAIEHTDPDYFCVGLQSHPEARDGPLDAVFAAFREAVAEN